MKSKAHITCGICQYEAYDAYCHVTQNGLVNKSWAPFVQPYALDGVIT